MSGVDRTIAAAAGLAVPAVLVLVTAFLAPVPAGSGTRGAEQVRLPVQDTVSVCPGPLVRDDAVEGLDEEFDLSAAPDTHVRAVTTSAAAPDGAVRAATLRAELLTQQGEEPAEQAGSPSRTLRFETPPGEPFVTGDDEVDAPAIFTGVPEGESPALASSVQTVQSDEDDSAGLAVHSCDAPLTHAVFSGAAAATGEDSRLLLGNPGDEPVTVSFELSGEGGPIHTAGASALTVAPQSVRQVPVGSLTTGAPVVGIEVLADQGAVTAALQHTRSEGLESRGAEYQSAQTEIAETLELPIATAGDARLRVTNPQDHAVTVSLSARGADGPHELAQSSLALPAGSTIEADLGQELPVGSVRIEADAPVTASATVSEGDDFAHYTAAPELGDTQLVTLPELAEAGELIVSPGSGLLEVAAIGADGEEEDLRVVELDPERIAVLDLADFPDAAALELRNPGSAQVSAALGLSSSSGVSGQTVPAPPAGVDYQDVRLER